MSRFYSDSDIITCLGYGSNEKLVSQVSQFRRNSCLNSDQKRKRKASTWILGDYPGDNVISMAPKKLKMESPNFGRTCSTSSSYEGSGCLEEEEEEVSCVTTTCSRVSVQPKTVAQIKLEKEMKIQKEAAVIALQEARKASVGKPNLRAAMMKCRFAETILRAQQKQGLGKSVDAERYKLDAKEEVRKEIQKQREAARKKLEDLEKSIVVVDNFKVLRDFESLISCRVSKSYVDCR